MKARMDELQVDWKGCADSDIVSSSVMDRALMKRFMIPPQLRDDEHRRIKVHRNVTSVNEFIRICRSDIAEFVLDFWQGIGYICQATCDFNSKNALKKLDELKIYEQPQPAEQDQIEEGE